MKRYVMTVLIMLDQFGNALLGGYAEETISRRMAYAASDGRWYGCLFCRLIQIIAPRHCDLTVPLKTLLYTRP